MKEGLIQDAKDHLAFVKKDQRLRELIIAFNSAFTALSIGFNLYYKSILEEKSKSSNIVDWYKVLDQEGQESLAYAHASIVVSVILTTISVQTIRNIKKGRYKKSPPFWVD